MIANWDLLSPAKEDTAKDQIHKKQSKQRKLVVLINEFKKQSFPPLENALEISRDGRRQNDIVVLLQLAKLKKQMKVLGRSKSVESALNFIAEEENSDFFASPRTKFSIFDFMQKAEEAALVIKETGGTAKRTDGELPAAKSVDSGGPGTGDGGPTRNSFNVLL
ncbi:hypothetical protein MHBO_004421 [Bonamia ostreae]|uniref:Uncharacterized protein n=1 Tax=Bonamia ostreae TaxID=126728 RepID=A0ABV2ATA6_9EUKA